MQTYILKTLKISILKIHCAQVQVWSGQSYILLSLFDKHLDIFFLQYCLLNPSPQ